MLPRPGQLEIRDLRLYGASDLRAMLREEGRRWHERLHWDYSNSIELLLEYLDARSLPGVVALENGRLRGYAFYVLEAAKAVIGDLFAAGPRGSVDDAKLPHLPTCAAILEPMLETIQATPGIDRIETQMLMFSAGELAPTFTAAGFHTQPRLFLLCDLLLAPLAPSNSLPEGLFLQRWQPEFYDRAAELILRAYDGHMDSNINDQYRTFEGAQRFLHNIVTFPGCGSFDMSNSWMLRSTSGQMLGLTLSSRLGTPRPPSLFGRLSNHFTGETAHITQLCLAPEARGLGLGRTLLEHTLRELRRSGFTELSLTVTEANMQARRLYDALGFETLHRFDAWVWERGDSRRQTIVDPATMRLP